MKEVRHESRKAAPACLHQPPPDKACRLIAEAAVEGADIVAFSETWSSRLSPRWITVADSVGLKREPAVDTSALGHCAWPRGRPGVRALARAGVDVVIGVAEPIRRHVVAPTARECRSAPDGDIRH